MAMSSTLQQIEKVSNTTIVAVGSLAGLIVALFVDPGDRPYIVLALISALPLHGLSTWSTTLNQKGQGS